jgi:hypothetical protein
VTRVEGKTCVAKTSEVYIEEALSASAKVESGKYGLQAFPDQKVRESLLDEVANRR